MSIKAKISDPITIKLGTGFNCVLADNNCDTDIPLKDGVMFAGDHYGFSIVTTFGGKESTYKTQRPINYVCMKSGVLTIIERDKTKAWSFSKTGVLKEECPDAFSEEFVKNYEDLINRKEEIDLDEPRMENPLKIYISRNPFESIIMPDEILPKKFPIFPGLMHNSARYGFVLYIETEDGQKEIQYPTKNIVDAVGLVKDFYGDLQVFEKGHYFLWTFTNRGEFISEAHDIKEIYNNDRQLDTDSKKKLKPNS